MLRNFLSSLVKVGAGSGHSVRGEQNRSTHLQLGLDDPHLPTLLRLFANLLHLGLNRVLLDLEGTQLLVYGLHDDREARRLQQSDLRKQQRKMLVREWCLWGRCGTLRRTGMLQDWTSCRRGGTCRMRCLADRSRDMCRQSWNDEARVVGYGGLIGRRFL